MNEPVAAEITQELERLADGPDLESADRKLRVDAVRNRERILEAAAAVFADRGLDASLDEVAHRAGVGVGTVYRRFPNKEALVDALFQKKIEDMVALAREAAGYPDPWQGFVHFIQQALEWQVRNRGFRQLLLHGDIGCHRVGAAREVITPILDGIIERAQAAGKLRSDVVANDVPMLVTMIGAVGDYVGCSDPQLWERYLALILDGLAAKRRTCAPMGHPPTQAVVDEAMSRSR